MVVSTGTLGKDGKALDEGGLMMMNLLVTRLVMKVLKIMIMIGKQRFRSTGSKLWVLMAMYQMWGLVMSMTMLVVKMHLRIIMMDKKSVVSKGRKSLFNTGQKTPRGWLKKICPTEIRNLKNLR